MAFKFILFVTVYFLGLCIVSFAIAGIVRHFKNQHKYSIAVTSVQQIKKEDIVNLFPTIKFDKLAQYDLTSFIMVTYEYAVQGGIRTSFNDAVEVAVDPTAVLIVKEDNYASKMEENSGITTHQLYACEPEQEYKLSIIDNRTKEIVVSYSFCTLMNEEDGDL